MPTNVYDAGDLVRTSVTFTNSAGNPADPTDITFYVTNPDGTVITYEYGTDAELVKDDTGDYHVDLTPSVYGMWYYRFVGTGDVISAGENFFVVKRSRI